MFPDTCLLYSLYQFHMVSEIGQHHAETRCTVYRAKDSSPESLCRIQKALYTSALAFAHALSARSGELP